MPTKLTKEEFDRLDLCDNCVHGIKYPYNKWFSCKLPDQLSTLKLSDRVCMIKSEQRHHMTVKKCDKYMEIK